MDGNLGKYEITTPCFVTENAGPEQVSRSRVANTNASKSSNFRTLSERPTAGFAVTLRLGKEKTSGFLVSVSKDPEARTGGTWGSGQA